MTSGKSNNQLAKTAGYFFPIILTLLFLYFAFKGIDLRESFGLISHSSISAIVLFIIVFFLSHLARAIRWKYMMNSIKKDVSLFNLFGSVMISYGVSCAVPRLGEIYRGLFLGKWEGISRSTVLGTIVVERIIDMAFFAAAVLLSVGIYAGDLYSKIPWLETTIHIGFILVFAALISLMLLIKFHERFINFIVRITGKSHGKAVEKIKSVFITLVSGFQSIKGTGNIIMLILWSVVILLLYALNSYLGFYILGMDSVRPVTFAMAWVLMTISSVGAMIPTPGSTGPYHAISILVLTKLFFFDNEISAAYAILTHLINYLLFIISTFLVIFIINEQRRRKGLQKETIFSVFKINN